MSRIQPVRMPSKLFVACGLFAILLVSPAAAFQSTVSEQSTSLERELTKLQTMFGKDHPKVIAMRKKVGLTRRLNDLVKDAPNSKAIIDVLYPLLVEEQELQARYGKDHPKLKIVRAKIELVRSRLPKNKAAAPAKTKSAGNKPSTQPVNDLLPLLMQEQELVARFGEKHPRVIALRKRIDQLRKTIPKVATPASRRGPATGNVRRPVDNTPNVDMDADKPARYSMEKKAGQIVLLDRETGKSWLLKTENGSTKWIPIPRTSDGEPTASVR